MNSLSGRLKCPADPANCVQLIRRCHIGIIIILLAFSATATANEYIECQTLNSFGDSHRVQLRINDTLRILCPNWSAIAADWQLKYENVAITPGIGLTNGTHIELTAQFHSPIKTTVAVMFHNRHRFETDVLVDTAPATPSTINCIQHGNRQIKCSLPIPAPLAKLQACIRWSLNHNSRESKDIICTNVYQNQRPINFTIPIDSFYEEYTMHVRLNNSFGAVNASFPFRPSDAFQPDRPDPPQPTQITDRSATLRWTTVESMQTLLQVPGMDLNYVLNYSAPAANHTNHDYWVDLHNLQPYTNYTVTLQSYTSKARLLSEPAFIQFRTAIGKPAASPKLEAGSYLLDIQTETLTIYWTPIDAHDWNGPSVRYNLSAAGMNCRQMSPVRGQCRRIVPAVQASEVTVRSVSHDGVLGADTCSRLSIPQTRLPQPEELALMVGHNGSQLFWKPPKQRQQQTQQDTIITSYTVLWGLSGEDDERIAVVDATAAIESGFWVPSSDERLHFAVAANSASSSSGLQRLSGSCRGREDAAIDELNIPKPTITQHTNNVTLQMDYRCSGHFHNFIITYCLANHSVCPPNQTVDYNQLQAFTISDLVADSVYRLRMYGRLRSSEQWVPVPSEQEFRTLKLIEEPTSSLAPILTLSLCAIFGILVVLRICWLLYRREKSLHPKLPMGLPIDPPQEPAAKPSAPPRARPSAPRPTAKELEVAVAAPDRCLRSTESLLDDDASDENQNSQGNCRYIPLSIFQKQRAQASSTARSSNKVHSVTPMDPTRSNVQLLKVTKCTLAEEPMFNANGYLLRPAFSSR